jgi:hypothetical protein
MVGEHRHSSAQQQQCARSQRTPVHRHLLDVMKE